jgi:hypothetical protein
LPALAPLTRCLGLYARPSYKGAAPNRYDGLLITSIGGDNLARANVFSGNGGNGIEIADNASGVTVDHDIAGLTTNGGGVGYGIAIMGRAYDNQVFKSFVGTKIGGVEALGNRKGGILVGDSAFHNSIGDTKSKASNLISGNIGDGVTLQESTRDNKVINNYVGLDRSGRKLRNTGRAVVNTGSDNTVRGNHHQPPGKVEVRAAHPQARPRARAR